jgi:hypothetical protein
MEKREKYEQDDDFDREDIHSKSVRAGKRTYFFDIKATRGNDYYLSITESKKCVGRDGQSFYEKHKIFLYKEDFEKFTDSLAEMIGYIVENNPSTVHSATEIEDKAFSQLEFEELGK